MKKFVDKTPLSPSQNGNGQDFMSLINTMSQFSAPQNNADDPTQNFAEGNGNYSAKNFAEGNAQSGYNPNYNDKNNSPQPSFEGNNNASSTGGNSDGTESSDAGEESTYEKLPPYLSRNNSTEKPQFFKKDTTADFIKKHNTARSQALHKKK